MEYHLDPNKQYDRIVRLPQTMTLTSPTVDGLSRMIREAQDMGFSLGFSSGYVSGPNAHYYQEVIERGFVERLQ